MVMTPPLNTEASGVDEIDQLLEDYGVFQRLHNEIGNQGWIARRDQAKAEIVRLIQQARIDENDYHWHAQRHIESVAKEGKISTYFLDRKAWLQSELRESRS